MSDRVTEVNRDAADGALPPEMPRYARPIETIRNDPETVPRTLVPFARAAESLEHSTLSPGSRLLLLGLLRTGAIRVFPGGGIGIEYGSLLKTAVRPGDLGEHVREVAAHLSKKRVDLLLVPGMSGYPVGAMYAVAAGIPAILLKKQKIPQVLNQTAEYPAGSFTIPSYTGEGDVVISADLDAVRDLVDSIVSAKLRDQMGADQVEIVLRCAGADDIIDKATMARAVTDCAPLVCAGALKDALERHRRVSGDERPIEARVDVVAWVTPLIKSYNQPRELLLRAYGIDPFAGISVTSLHLEIGAIGIEGAGTFAFSR